MVNKNMSCIVVFKVGGHPPWVQVSPPQTNSRHAMIVYTIYRSNPVRPLTRRFRRWYFNVDDKRFCIRDSIKSHHRFINKKRYFYQKQIRIFNYWYTRKSISTDNKCYRAMELMAKMYDDRDKRYELYFTQGIVEPYGDEANTFLALTR